MSTLPSSNEKPLILITGSSGLIGSRLAESVLGQFRVVGLDVAPPEGTAAQYPWIECDLTDDESVASALRHVRQEYGDRIASVIHLAAYYDFSGKPSPLYEQLTVEGTRRLLRHLQHLRVEQFVFSSTLLVMKPSDDNHPINVFSAVEAEWDYPRSKLAAEQVIRQERNGIPTVRLRIAGVYDEACHSLPIAQQISRIYQKQLESYLFPGDTSSGQAFIHLNDLADCFLHVIQRRHELPPEVVFLIGEEDVMSYAELQEELGQLIHGQQWPTIRIPKAVAKAGAWVNDKLAGSDEDGPFIKPWMIDLADQNYPLTIERARTQLQWEPRHSLRRTLPQMIARLHQDPQGWFETNGLPIPEEAAKDEQAGATKT